mgnify:FL=1
MTVDEIQTLATQYAYDIVTCPGSPDTEDGIQEVLDKWSDDEVHEDVIVWQPFEIYTPQELLGTLRDLELAFLRFEKEVSEKRLTNSESGV